jgi:hypothetical protein
LAFDLVLREILNDAAVSLEPRFIQQRRLDRSVPDGAIQQAAFNLFIEAKAGAPLTEPQLKAHLDGIKADGLGGRQCYLMALTPKPLDAGMLDRVRTHAEPLDIVFAAATFAEVVQALHSGCSDLTRLKSVVADYEAFLDRAGVLPASDLIAVFPVGTSIADNVRFNCYYEPASRASKQSCAYLALYARKRITHIADMPQPFIAATAAGKLTVSGEATGQPADALATTRIDKIVRVTTYYDLMLSPHRFYLVDTFHETNLVKVSPGGLAGFRYLRAQDLGVAGTPRASDLATQLAGKIFS